MRILKKFRALLITLLLVISTFLFAGCELVVEDESANGSSTQNVTQGQEDTDVGDEEQSSASQEKSTQEETTEKATTEEKTTQAAIDKNGSYNSKDDVALYIHTYGTLPSNYITKEEARDLGWTGGSVEKYAEGKAIGGDYFGNYEGLLPKKNGRKYTECDIDTIGKSSRGAKRIIFSNDGLIYYTDDHYESFTLLYGEE